MAGYLLDTNVLSELMRKEPAQHVLAWFENQQDAVFCTSAVTRAELLLGVALLPPGKRRNRIADAVERTFDEEFPGHCLPFDAVAAEEYAVLVAARIRAGKPISTEDGQIAAIALANGLSLVTRNYRDFAGIAGLPLFDPWHS